MQLCKNLLRDACDDFTEGTHKSDEPVWGGKPKLIEP